MAEDKEPKKQLKRTAEKEAARPQPAARPGPERERTAADGAERAGPVRKVESPRKEGHRADAEPVPGPDKKAEPPRKEGPEPVPAPGPEVARKVRTAGKAQPSAAEAAKPKPSGKEPAPEAGEQARAEGEPAKEGEAPAEEEAEIIEEEPAEKKAKVGKKRSRKAVTIKPELPEGIRRALGLRARLKDRTPDFVRQESYNYGRVGEKWRRPRGTHSKMRHHIKYRINVVSIGYGGPRASRGLHPSGFREVLVHHPRELDGMDPKLEAARVAHGVGSNKRRMIARRAERMGIRVLNELNE